MVEKALDVALRKEEMGHSQLPLHTTSPPPFPLPQPPAPETLIRQAPEINKTT